MNAEQCDDEADGGDGDEGDRQREGPAFRRRSESGALRERGRKCLDAAQDRPVRRSGQAAEQHGSDGADGGGLGGGRETDQDRAQNGDDQHHGRHHGGEERDQRPAIEGRLLVEDGRARPGAQQRHARLIEKVHRDQSEPRQQRPGEEVADRQRLRRGDAERALRLLIGRRQDIAEEDEHDRGRDDLPQRAGGGDRAGGKRRVVAALEHRRQRHQPHGDDGRSDDAGGGREKRADDGDREAEAAAHRPEEATHGVEQVFRHMRFLEHHAHDDEERHGEQEIVLRDADDALGQEQDEVGLHEPAGEPDGGEQERRAAEDEGDRIAGQQESEERQKEERDKERRERRHRSPSCLPNSRRARSRSRARPWMVSVRAARRMVAFRT